MVRERFDGNRNHNNDDAQQVLVQPLLKIITSHIKTLIICSLNHRPSFFEFYHEGIIRNRVIGVENILAFKVIDVLSLINYVNENKSAYINNCGA